MKNMFDDPELLDPNCPMFGLPEEIPVNKVDPTIADPLHVSNLDDVESQSEPVPRNLFNAAVEMNRKIRQQVKPNQEFLVRLVSSFKPLLPEDESPKNLRRNVVNSLRGSDKKKTRTFLALSNDNRALVEKYLDLIAESKRPGTMYITRDKARTEAETVRDRLITNYEIIQDIISEQYTEYCAYLDNRNTLQLWLWDIQDLADNTPTHPDMLIMFYALANFLFSNYGQYSAFHLYKDEMIESAVETCVMRFDNFDPEQAKSSVSYFWSIIRSAFYHILRHEYREMEEARDEMGKRIAKVIHMPDQIDYKLIYSKDQL